MNIVIIAWHHGAFLTLRSCLQEIGRGHNIVTLIPRPQLEKYTTKFTEPEFVNYKQNIATAAQFVDSDVFLCDWDEKNPVCSAMNAAFLASLRGETLFLMAGTVLMKTPPKGSVNGPALKFARERSYRGNKRLDMYAMIGLDKDSALFDRSAWLADIQPDYYTSKDSELILEEADKNFLSRPDVLIGTALSGNDTIMHGVRAVNDVCVLSYWKNAIRHNENQFSDELFAYPYDKYLALAEQVGTYLPPSSLEKITKNGHDTSEWVAKIRDEIYTTS